MVTASGDELEPIHAPFIAATVILPEPDTLGAIMMEVVPCPDKMEPIAEAIVHVYEVAPLTGDME
jgi:hypothetical protein